MATIRDERLLGETRLQQKLLTILTILTILQHLPNVGEALVWSPALQKQKENKQTKIIKNKKAILKKESAK